ncbi:MAG: SusC/RagA family TonB-linked outer membrane protein [Bacteroidales bacterium]|nr:SusC/RagA family TonB-linked outer membrane protein [Bacteroidales bacterium]
MNRILTFLLLVFLCITGAFAQQQITGNVKDEDNNPLPGANVFNKTTKEGVITDVGGNFTIQAGPADSIMISFVGYLTEDVTPGNETYIDINLIPNITSLDEVVVTALGISREVKSIGFAQQSVSAQELTEARDPNITTALAGKVSGLQVISNGGPTSSATIVIRGMASLSNRNDPIWVIDGVPIINNSGQQADDREIDYGNDAADLNPDMIESIEVLKGPNAAALYGSIAQNGAILITTKKGTSQNRLGVTLSSNIMFHQVREYPDYQNVYGAGHVLQIGREETQRDDSTGYPIVGSYMRSWGAPMLGQNVVNYNGELTTYDPEPDNVKDFYQTGKVYTNTITLDRAYEKGSFRFTYTNVSGTDIVPDHNVQKSHNVNLRAVKEFSTFLNVNAGVIWMDEKVKNRMYRNWNPRNPMNTFIYMHRNNSLEDLDPWKGEDGRAINQFEGDQYDNPLWLLNEIWNEDSKNRFIGDITLYGEILKNFSYRIRFNQDYIQREGCDFNNWGADYDDDGSYSNFISTNSQRNYEGILTYSSDINDVLTYSVNLGLNQRESDGLRRWASISSLIMPDEASIYNSLDDPQTGESRWSKVTQSVFGFINLGFKDLIFLDLTARNDWSSTLPDDNNSYFYPSVSTSIVYSDIFNIRENILPFGKLRFSWAKVGNDTDPYQTQNAYEYGGMYNENPWMFLNRVRRNEELKPEETTSFEIGLDNRFFNNRLSFDITLYKQYTVNQIVSIKVPAPSGYSDKVVNVGRIDNKGIELSFGVKPIDRKNFDWEILLNWSKNDNEVVELDSTGAPFWLNSMIGVNIFAEVGRPYGVLRGTTQLHTSDGRPLIDPNSLEPIYIDDGYLGNAFPEWIGSVRNSFRYKNFDLGILIDFQKGGTLYSVGNHKAQVWGNTTRSLEGREEWRFSAWILGESDDERRGIGIDGSEYNDSDRSKGIWVEGWFPLLDEEGNYVYDENGNIVADEWGGGYVLPQNWWQLADKHMIQNTFDRSFVKLREVTLGYTVPYSKLKNLPFERIRVAAVGRNLWTIFKNTPNGIDPESTSTVGNGQGVEFGSVLPTAYYGFDVKISF